MVDITRPIMPQGLAALGLAIATPGSVAGAYNLIGGKITSSVVSNALTLSVKTLDDDDPSANSPVFISIPSDTLGDFQVVAHSDGPLSITIPSGAELGHVANKPLRVYLAAFSMSSTHMNLAVCNTQGSGSRLNERFKTAPDPIGTSSDSGNTVYTSELISVFAQKYHRIIGYAEWDASSMATPGTWVAPDRVRLFGPLTPKPGSPLMQVSYLSNAVSTITDTVPFDDTIPNSPTEGDEFLTFSPALSSLAEAQDYVSLEGYINCSHTVASSIAFGFSNGAWMTVNWGEVFASGLGTTQVRAQWAGRISDAPAGLSAGPNSAGTLTINGRNSGNRNFGGDMYSGAIATIYRG